jgi:hypothetical protein
MELTDVHRGLIAKANRQLIETGDLSIKDLGMDTKDFYAHFPGGLNELKKELALQDKQK